MGIDAAIEVELSFASAAGYLQSIADHLAHVGDHEGRHARPTANLELCVNGSQTILIAADRPEAAVGKRLVSLCSNMTQVLVPVVLWSAQEQVLSEMKSITMWSNVRTYAGIEQAELGVVRLALSANTQADRLRIGFWGASDALCAGIVGSMYLRRLLVESARWFDPAAIAQIEIGGFYADLFGPVVELPNQFTEHPAYALALGPDAALNYFARSSSA